MNYLEQFTDEQLDTMVLQIEELAQNDETEIYKVIGKALNHEGFRTDTSARTFKLSPGFRSFSAKGVTIHKAQEFLDTPLPPLPQNQTEEGKRFWEKFKEKLKKEICTNETIVKLMTKEATLKEYLTVGLPLIAAALGLGTLISPAMLLVIASVFALIIKVGFKTYCDLE